MAKNNKKKADAPVRVRTKKKNVLMRSTRDARPFTSVGEFKLYELTQEQKIAQGYQPPLIETPNFEKSEKEKDQLKRVKSKLSYHVPGPGVPPSPYEYTTHRATVYLKQKKGRNDSTFANVRSAEIKPSDLAMYLNSLRNRDVHIVRYDFMGETTVYGKEG